MPITASQVNTLIRFINIWIVSSLCQRKAILIIDLHMIRLICIMVNEL